MGNDVCDLCVTNLSNDYYVSSVRVKGVDALPFGIEGIARRRSVRSKWFSVPGEDAFRGAGDRRG
jgi:hypothetical protein